MTQSLKLKLAAKRALTADITEFEFQAYSGSLPPFQAGAHVNIHTPSGAWRSYSLSNDETQIARYVIAVKREDGGRGGSLSLHRDLNVGDTVEGRAPRNAIALTQADRFLLIAGGIGITPMLSMLRRLVREHANVHMIYLTRDADQTAYRDLLTAAPYADHVTIHHDQGDRARSLDLWPWFETPDHHHIFYCGPKAMMQAVYLQTIHWPRSQIHSESFAGVEVTDGQAQPFRLRRASTGDVFTVPADRSILDVLRSEGIPFESSCESGTCGTCQMRVLSGEVHHRDAFLSDTERLNSIMPCVSRAAGEEITLDF